MLLTSILWCPVRNEGEQVGNYVQGSVTGTLIRCFVGAKEAPSLPQQMRRVPRGSPINQRIVKLTPQSEDLLQALVMDIRISSSPSYIQNFHPKYTFYHILFFCGTRIVSFHQACVLYYPSFKIFFFFFLMWTIFKVLN